jgi:chromosomal replication initiation ATPase DnaA
MGRDDFFVTGSNAAALAMVEGWRDWPFGKLVLVGPEGAGKTHLAHVWAAQSGARVIVAEELSEADVAQARGAMAVEDVDRIAGDLAAETCLFHLHNALAQLGAPMLLTARRPPAQWGLGCPIWTAGCARRRWPGSTRRTMRFCRRFCSSSPMTGG